MTRTILLLLLTVVGCAHAPRVEVVTSETRVAPMVIRGAAVDLLLAARPFGGTLDQKVMGSPSHLGVIDFTSTSKTNHQATTPFTNTGTALCGKLLLLQPTTAVYILPVSTNTGTVTSTTGVELAAKERVIILFRDTSDCWIAALRVSADGNLKAWELL